LGTANIACKNWQAIRLAENSVLVAVASRDLARARRFIEECQAEVPFLKTPEPCGSYEELIQRRDIDAVYIPLPTRIRKEWVLRAAEAGKHILSEKPCGASSEDLRTMLDCCRRNRVQFMDGVMFMHSQRLPRLRQVLDDPQEIGTIRHMVSHFTFRGDEDFLARNIRSDSDLEPLGCLGDLGWYNIRFFLWAMNDQLPERVAGRLLAQHCRSREHQPVPIEFLGELFFPGDVSAVFFCSFLAETQQWTLVSGTRGYLRIPDFVLPFYGNEAAFEVNQLVFRVRGCDFNMENHSRRIAVQEYSNSAPDSQETNMIRRFAGMVTSGQLEPRWGDLALKTQLILDACLRSARENNHMVAVTE
jgi:predicted dehydrogenase